MATSSASVSMMRARRLGGAPMMAFALIWAQGLPSTAWTRHAVREHFADCNQHQPRDVQRFFPGTLDDVHDVAGRYLARRQMADAPVDIIPAIAVAVPQW